MRNKLTVQKNQMVKIGKVSQNTLGGTHGPMIEGGYWRPIYK